VRLQIGPLVQELVVTAAAAVVPQSQIGANVTVIDSATLETLGNLDLLEPLRTVPGAAVVQAGARGGGTSLFIRGGASNFNKVLLDGVPANDIGGAFDFADVTTTAVERVEVLRGSNSVLYGSDALTGVVNVTTARGRSRTPQATSPSTAQPEHVARGPVARRRGQTGGLLRRLRAPADRQQRAEQQVPQRHVRRAHRRRRPAATRT